MKLAFSYFIFAIFATIANIAAQDISLRVYQGNFSFPLSVLFGTAIGLIVKYILDKKYIFKFRSIDIAHDSRVFFLYMLMGVFTTLIFWGFEFSFDCFFETKSMRYTGGIIGLSIGYYIKYRLDKRFVFITKEI